MLWIKRPKMYKTSCRDFIGNYEIRRAHNANNNIIINDIIRENVCLNVLLFFLYVTAIVFVRTV